MLGIVGFAILHLFSVIIVEAFIHLLYGTVIKTNIKMRKTEKLNANPQIFNCIGYGIVACKNKSSR